MINIKNYLRYGIGFLNLFLSCTYLQATDFEKFAHSYYEKNIQDQPGLSSRVTLEDCLSLACDEEVFLIKKDLTDLDIQTLRPLIEQNTNLRSLDLSINKIGPRGAQILSGFLKTVTTLNLEKNNVGDEGAIALAGNPYLEKLNLTENEVSFSGAIALAQNTTLISLTLYRNIVGDLGASAFAVNTNLKTLDLRRNTITNRGADALSHNTTLTILMIGRNAITDEGAQSFLRMQQLEYLELKDTQVTNVQNFPFEVLATQKVLPSSRPRDLSLDDKQTILILSVDGGGIRGLIPAMILQHIEDKLKRKLKNQDSVHLTQAFDMMAGTSTGGLICLGLSVPDLEDKKMPRYTSDDLVNLYKKKGQVIFPKNSLTWLKAYKESPYDPSGLEGELFDFFADNILSESLSHLLITAFDLRQDTQRVFNSRKAQKNNRKDFLMRDVGRSTSAAPTYFPAAYIQNLPGDEYLFIDGGVFANNPTLLAVEEARRCYPYAQRYIVLSLGTGAGLRTRRYDELKKSGKLKWANQITDHLMGNMEDTTAKNLRDLEHRDPRLEVIRIQPYLSENEKHMDNVEESNLVRLENAARSACKDNKEAINSIVEVLQDAIREKSFL